MSYKRAVVTEFGKPEVLKIVEENNLPEPKPNEVRIKVLYAGVNFTDVMIRKGKYPELKKKPPFSPGYDMVGVVDKLGDGACRIELGQKVADLTVIGAHSEYLCLPENKLTPLPDNINPAEAVSLILSYVTAYQLLHRVAKVKKGRSILVHGAGGAVGTAILQLGALFGLKMYGTASKSKNDIVADLGASPIDYKNEDFVEKIKNETENGVNAVFDPIGGENLKRSFSSLKKGGKLVSYGFYNSVVGNGGSPILDLIKLKLWNLFPNGRSTAFYSIGALRKKHNDWFVGDLNTLFNLLEKDKIKPIISAIKPMSDIVETHKLIEQAKTKGKVVLKVSGTS